MTAARRLYLPTLLLLIACSGSSERGAEAAMDTLTRAQRDSIVGASQLPGARSVQRAIDVSDSAAARNAEMDSLMRQE